MADFYDLLGVSRDVDPDSLKRAYRRMARQYHPDINKDPGAEAESDGPGPIDTFTMAWRSTRPSRW